MTNIASNAFPLAVFGKSDSDMFKITLNSGLTLI